MEIERKWLLKEVPKDLEERESFPIEQYYISTDPVIRVRKRGEEHFLTVKGSGMLAHEEVEMRISGEAYGRLAAKADGCPIIKRRYLIPLEDGKVIELDHFQSPNEGLYLAEVEFGSVEEAEAFKAPEWFGRDVTMDSAYHNSVMAANAAAKEGK